MRSFYHEISIVRQKNNKNRKICDNIIEIPFLCFETILEMQTFFINKVIAHEKQEGNV